MAAAACLAYASGAFFGTTLGGGTGNFGTVFEMTPAGSLSILYNFQGGDDASFPASKLLYDRGTLYGTTGTGGGNSRTCSGGVGWGTVSTVTP